jgi:hypothetical protein
MADWSGPLTRCCGCAASVLPFSATLLLRLKDKEIIGEATATMIILFPEEKI